MTCLHMVSSLPTSSAFQRAVKSVLAGDTLLLCDDAVYAAELPSINNVLVMQQCVQARGIESPFELADYQTMVDLVCQHEKQIQWG